MPSATTSADPKGLAFLGAEFLTWLWYRSEQQGGVFELPSGEEASLVFNDYAALAAEEGEQSILKKGSPHRSPEARSALGAGKLVRAARLEVALGERLYALTVAGDTLDVRSVRYPKLEEATPADREVESLAAMDEVAAIVDGLYARFLEVRAGEAWLAREVPAMEAWVREHLGG